MWPTKAREDVELLELFEASGRNVQRASCLLRDLFAEFPLQLGFEPKVMFVVNDGGVSHLALLRLGAASTLPSKY